MLAGEYPGAKTPDAAEEKIDLLIDHGVRTFIDLTQPDDGLAPYVDHVERIGEQRGLELRHRPYPIPDMSVRPHDGYDEIVDAVRESADALYRRRNDAESINRHLDDTLWLRRAHSVGNRVSC